MDLPPSRPTSPPFSRRQVLTCIAATAATLPPLLACSGGSGEAGGDLAGADTFTLPREVFVSLTPYGSVEEALNDEQFIDWRRDNAKARAISLAYAAKELRDHLALAGVAVNITVGSAPSAVPAIVLQVHAPGEPDTPAGPDGPRVAYAELGNQGYAITPWRGQILISANDRVGVLNGVYGLLDMLGFAWFDPYETHLPEPGALLRPITWRARQEVPRVGLRGYWVYGDARLPDEFAVWLARTRLNVGGRAVSHLHHKLGLIGWGGGHDLLQQEFSRPGLFEQHPEWFALIADIRRPVQATGDYFNPAFWNVDAAKYFAQRMVERLETGDLRDLDVLNIWPADSRFNPFDQSPEAIALGNETDNLLNFYVNVAAQLREAFVQGRLSRPVTVAGISYFLTMRAPTNAAVVAALQGADYVHIFYPIDRGWSGRIDADLAARDANRQYIEDMRAWRRSAKLSFGVVDYLNLSSYAAVDLSDFPNFAANLATVSHDQDALYAYMHPLLKNPGSRRLTNRLLSRLTWKELGPPGDVSGSPTTAADGLIQDYFSRRYGAYASRWRAVHELMSQSVDNAQEMFGINSFYWLLCQEVVWIPPIYKRQEAAAFIPAFRNGGQVELPGAFSNRPFVRASFRGLDDSLRLQERAAELWAAILAEPVPIDVRRRMDGDVEWFAATCSRYRLMAATSDYLVARLNVQDLTLPRSRIEREVAFLRQSPVTADTISPVDQRSFVDFHETIARTP